MPIEQFVQEVIKHINAALYVGRFGPEAGKFVLRLIRADYDVASIPKFDESSIEKFENYKRTEVGELVNSVTVNYWDSATGKTASTTAQDPALVQQQGAVINTAMQYVGFTNADVASRVSLRDLQTLSTPLASGTITFKPKSSPSDPGPDPALLNIGDVIGVSWDDYGLIELPMRVTALTLGDGKTHKVKATVTQDTFAMPEFGVIVPPTVGWEDPSQEPIPLTRQYAEEMPYYELVQQMSQSVVDAQLSTEPDLGIVGAAAARPQSGAINARFVVDSGAGYEDVGAIDFSPSALLDVAVDKMATSFTVASVTDIESIELGQYAKIGSEYVAVTNRVGLTLTVKRGVLDTTPQEHGSGSVIIFSDPFVQVGPTEYVDSDVLAVKLLTVAGQGTVDPEFATPLPVEMDSRAIRPYPPGDFQINGSYYPNAVAGGDVTVSFKTRNRVLQTGGELVGFLDGDVTPEPGTTFGVQLRDPVTNAVLYTDESASASPIVVPGSSFTLDEVLMQLYSIRDGYRSWQAQEHVVETGMTLWTPAYLGTKATLWVDDTSGITEVSGAVSQLNDVSGNNYHLTQSSPSLRPVAVANALNGRRVLRFDGSNDRMLGPTGAAQSVLSGIGEAWSITVIKSSSSSSGNRYHFSITEQSSNNAQYLEVSSSTTGGTFTNRPGLGGRRVTGTSYSETRSAVAVGTDWHVALKRLKYSSATGVVNVNGGPDESGVMSNMSAGLTNVTTRSQFKFGGDDNNYHNGDIAEFLFGVGTLSQADIDRLFGYLAHKWGLAASLPPGHPYKAAPPLLEGYGNLYGESYGE